MLSLRILRIIKLNNYFYFYTHKNVGSATSIADLYLEVVFEDIFERNKFHI